MGADLLQFAGNGGVLVGQVRMAGPGVDDAQGVAAGGKIKFHRLNDGVVGLGKVNGHHAAHGGGGLVHETAGLAKEHVLGVLADHGDLRLGHPAVEEQVVQNGADEDLVGGGGAEAGAGQHRGFHVGVKATDRATQLHEAGGHAPNQGGGGVHLGGHGGQGVQGHGGHGVALGENADDAGIRHTDGGDHVQIHGSSQDPAMLMVGVVAADLRAAGGGEVALRGGAESGGEAGIQSRALLVGQIKSRCGHKRTS